MIRVIIADDEEKVCRLIDHLIDWTELNMELAGVAMNGIEALAMIKEKKPDLVLTDIRMPGYDGLELLKRARKCNPNIEFIIITGHSQFEYAQTAIRYGVKDYILKPVKKQQLGATLKEVKDRYNKLHEAEEMGKIQQERIKRNEGQLRTFWLGSLLEEETQEALAREEVNKKYGYNFRVGVFQAFMVRADLVKNESMRMVSLRKTLEVLYAKAVVMLKDALAPICFEAEVCVAEETVAGILNYRPEKMNEVRILLKSFIKDFGVEINIFEEIQFHLSVSKADENFGLLQEKMKNARYAMEQRVFTSQAVFLENVPELGEWNAEEAYKTFSSEVRQSMDFQNTEYIQKAIERLKEEVWEKKVCGWQLLKVVCDVYHLFLISSLFQKEICFGNRREKEEAFRHKVLLCSSAEHIFSFLMECCVRDLNENSKRINMRKARPINQAKEYIRENYDQPLTLEELGNVVGFSSSYFSTVFHKETGKTFLEYLTDVRMEEAKRLLRETSRTIESISSEIGMNDYKRFSKLFRRMSGITPKEYRKLYS